MLAAMRTALLGQPAVVVQSAPQVFAVVAGFYTHGYASTTSSTGSMSGSESSSATSFSANEGATDSPDRGSMEPPQLPVQRHLVDQFLSVTNMNRRQRLLQRKPGIIADFQRGPGDTGSPEVQVALLTARIRDMTEHVVVNKKDHVAKRGLQGLLNQRRKLLSYLRRDNFPRYAFVLHKLGLKDTYAKQERYDRYRVGTRLGTPAEPLKRYGSH